MTPMIPIIGGPSAGDTTDAVANPAFRSQGLTPPPPGA